ncbi:MAG: SUMF1/EgtB/PvdO family nonheme iron enzyme [Acidobacteria bacterium]|nr:SUMF1/EgtB/PvdO family nonheme iron enzyme [Acidobacteriota bacterium]
MTPEHWQVIKGIIEQALDYEPAQRNSFLQRVCAQDPSLLTEVKQFLTLDSKLDQFLESFALVNLPPSTLLPADHLPTLYPEPSASFAPNDTFLGKYVILRVLGQGGMGTVYLARHLTLETLFAIKVLKPHLIQSRDAIERFQREARITALIEHPNVVRVFDVGVEENRCYLVMEYLNGESLRQRLNRHKRFSVAQIAMWIDQVYAALQIVHQHGVIHRDLKPDNIFFHRQGDQEVVKILDFGIAKPASFAETMTDPGSICGTPAYMSPEQCTGDKLDEASDLYSLGVILFEMLTGTRPFESEKPLTVMYRHVNLQPPDVRHLVPTIPATVATLIQALLSKSPQKRIAVAHTLVATFQAAAQGHNLLDTTPHPMVETHPNLTDSGRVTLPLQAAFRQPRPLQKWMYAGLAGGILVALGIGVQTWKPGLLSNVAPAVVRHLPVAQPVPTLKKDLGDRFVFISGGEVSIGANPGDCQKLPGCRIEPDELPAHRVELSPFYLCKFEVTNQEYQEFITLTGHPPPPHWPKGTFPPESEDLPVTNVSWLDATAYCSWRSTRDGIPFRLPTEAEWEHAARGPKGTIFTWGDRWQSQWANTNPAPNTYPPLLSILQPPNNTTDCSAFGLYAMAGNVSEWTSSDFVPYPGSPYRPKSKDSQCKVYRGGSYLTPANGARNSLRSWTMPTTRQEDLGFRLAVSAK